MEAPVSAPPARDRTWLGLIFLALLLAASMWLVRQADDTKSADWNEEKLTYLPSGKLLKPMVLDFDEAAADLLWIDAMMYFADAYLSGKSDAWLGHMLDIISQLNPRFYQVYEFSGTALAKNKGQLRQSLALLDRGIGQFPKDWKLRVYAAMARLGLDSGYAAAAEYLRPVTLDADVPDHIRTLCATFLSKGGGRKVALAFLVDRWLNSSNAINREIFVQKILRLYPGGPQPEPKRREMINKILQEVSYEPSIQMVGLGVMHQYLTDSVDAAGRRLIDLLEK
ncbi:MAG: hypothetical protein JF616_07445 [Fibrobacteres bacterium]|nr:hypothetical protein [Fibrobacterota bacterium]